MQDFTKRRKNKNIQARFLLGVAFVAFLGFVTFGATRAAWGMYGKFIAASDSNMAAVHNLSELKKQQASIEAEVQALHTPEGEEAQLRESYGVAMPGEGEIQIVQIPSTSTSAVAAPQGTFFGRILGALFNW